jgi:hypothetical protein
MFRPRQISFRFPRLTFVKRKVTPPDEELRTIPPSPFVKNVRTKYCVCLLLDFSKRVLAGARETSHSQICHLHPGSSWPFFLLHPLPHSLSHAFSTSEHWQHLFLWKLTSRALLEIKNTTLTFHLKKKDKMQ